jgi:hypothetical protein
MLSSAWLGRIGLGNAKRFGNVAQIAPERAGQVGVRHLAGDTLHCLVVHEPHVITNSDEIVSADAGDAEVLFLSFAHIVRLVIRADKFDLPSAPLAPAAADPAVQRLRQVGEGNVLEAFAARYETPPAHPPRVLADAVAPRRGTARHDPVVLAPAM